LFEKWKSTWKYGKCMGNYGEKYGTLMKNIWETMGTQT
jgi:hypothetical protein